MGMSIKQMHFIRSDTCSFSESYLVKLEQKYVNQADKLPAQVLASYWWQRSIRDIEIYDMTGIYKDAFTLMVHSHLRFYQILREL